MYGIYRVSDDTAIFQTGYWREREEANRACRESFNAQYCVRWNECASTYGVEVEQRRIQHYRRNADDTVAFAVSAQQVDTGSRQCHGWYRSLETAMKKRNKMRHLEMWHDWVVEQFWFDSLAYSENVDCDTESGDLV